MPSEISSLLLLRFSFTSYSGKDVLFAGLKLDGEIRDGGEKNCIFLN